MALAVTSSSTAISGSSFSRSGASSDPKGTKLSFIFSGNWVLILRLLLVATICWIFNFVLIGIWCIAALQICSLRLSDRIHVATLSQRRYSVRSESHTRSEALVARASTLIAPGSLLFSIDCFVRFADSDFDGLLLSTEVEEKEGEVEDFEQLAKKLEDASPLEIMDKALEKFGNDIAIAFR